MRVVVVGSGGVAEALVKNIPAEVLVQVYGRNNQRISELSAICGVSTSDDLQAADLYVLAISDDSVSEVAATLPFADGSMVVHTAGSVSISVLDGATERNATLSTGVLYPMQSFTVGREIAFDDLPIFVEGCDDEALAKVSDFAKMLSHRVITMSSEERCRLHIAAVFACNFTNAMFTASSDILNEAGLDFDLYAPLIRETVDKVLELNNPRASQTGPAKRGDKTTMESHIALLQRGGDQGLVDLYRDISRYIMQIKVLKP